LWYNLTRPAMDEVERLRVQLKEAERRKAASAAAMTAAAAPASGEPAPAGRPPWRKILYQRQPYEDNHVDHKFLAKLQTNANVVIHDLWTIVEGTLVITQQVSMVAIFGEWRAACLRQGTLLALGPPLTHARLTHTGIVFCYTIDGSLSYNFLLVVDVSLILAGVLMIVVHDELVNDEEDGTQFVHAMLPGKLATVVLFLGVCYILAPILRTLTSSFSRDAIYALTILLLVAHICLHDVRALHLLNCGWLLLLLRPAPHRRER